MKIAFTRALLLIYTYASILMPLQAAAGPVPLSDQPLFLPVKVDPNVMFSLATQWPMAETAAYTDLPYTDPDATSCPGTVTDPAVSRIGDPNAGDPSSLVGVCYFESQTYQGYFDPAKCYSYSVSGGYFVPAARASAHRCNGAWSGNLLNWATMTTVDEFRWATTGGTRDIDLPATATTPGVTVLTRAFKNRGPNDSVFHIKRIAPTAVSGTSVVQVMSSAVTPLAVDTTLYLGNQDGNLLIWAATPGITGLVADPAIKVPGGSSASPGLYPLGGYRVRVLVCDPTVSLESNCQAYSDPSQATPVVTWKPTGLIQSYAASMRFGVASYLYDTTPNLNGGVLRSNIKYVGAQTKDPLHGTQANALREWDPVTGVLVNNPGDPANAPVPSCGAGTGCSGVINYINGFGYASEDYTAFGPVSELYYEVLRYFINPANGPTVDYIGGTAGASSSQRDGFPVVSTWQDPVQYSCQKNVIVQVGDSDSACDFNLPGNAGGSTLGAGRCLAHNSHPLANASGRSESWADVVSFTNAVGQFEGGLPSPLGASFGGALTPYSVAGSGTSGGPVGPGGPAGGGPGGGPSGGSGGGTGGNSSTIQLPDSWYLAGLAWWAHVNDIRADSGAQDASQGFQNVTSYFVDVQKPGSWGWGGAIRPNPPNQYWLAAKYGGFSFAASGVPDQAPTSLASWSSSGTLPDNYLYGGKPLTLVNRLAALFASVTGGQGSLASIGSNSGAVQAGSQVFQGAANTADWSGHLYATALDRSGTLSTVSQDAAPLLTTVAPDNRVILSWNDETASTVPFRLASLSTSARSLLGGTSGNDTGLVNYLRGDHSNEGTAIGQFRPRRTTFPGSISPSPYVLGDIIDSTPAYVGPVQPDGQSARTPMVYVGANDGMLHAFAATDPSSGTQLQEKFAFVPSNLIPQLPALANPGYSHQFFVDGSPAVAETVIGGTPRTVLAETLRKGGRGVFALDVTNPDAWTGSETAAASAHPVIWQFTSDVDADLGYTFSEPQIVKTAALDANGRNRWAVVIGNGYNSPGSGQAALFVIFLDRTPTVGAPWVAGQDYVKLLTSVSTASASSPNGMATPTLISADGSGVATTAYAGDLLGNLWKFDLSSSNPAQWASPVGANGSTPSAIASVPLYTAKTSAGVLQPITTAPEVVKFPRGGWMVLFGTGRALDGSDLSDTSLQTFYGIRDTGTNTQIASRDANPNLLQAQQILSSTLSVVNADNSTSHYRQVSTNSVTYPQKMGWYLDLIDAVGATPHGERLAFNPSIDFGRIAFTTLVPSAAQDTTTCQGGGSSWNMLLDPYSGGALNRAVFDVNKDLAFNSADTLTGSDGTTQIYAAGLQSSNGVQGNGLTLVMSGGCGGSGCHERIQTGSGGLAAARFEGDGASFQRLAWREITHG